MRCRGEIASCSRRPRDDEAVGDARSKVSRLPGGLRDSKFAAVGIAVTFSPKTQECRSPVAGIVQEGPPANETQYRVYGHRALAEHELMYRDIRKSQREFDPEPPLAVAHSRRFRRQEIRQPPVRTGSFPDSLLVPRSVPAVESPRDVPPHWRCMRERVLRIAVKRLACMIVPNR